jgi:hypothetical protein
MDDGSELPMGSPFNATLDYAGTETIRAIAYVGMGFIVQGVLLLMVVAWNCCFSIYVIRKLGKLGADKTKRHKNK